MAQQPKQSRGASDKVPCPHCGQPNYFKDHVDLGLLEVQNNVKPTEASAFPCDHCHQWMMVVSVQVVTVVSVVQCQPKRGS